MRVLVAVTVCVVIDDDRDQLRQAVSCRNPQDDLLRRLRREMKQGRDSGNWRTPDGAKVA